MKNIKICLSIALSILIWCSFALLVFFFKKEIVSFLDIVTGYVFSAILYLFTGAFSVMISNYYFSNTYPIDSNKKEKHKEFLNILFIVLNSIFMCICFKYKIILIMYPVFGIVACYSYLKPKEVVNKTIVRNNFVKKISYEELGEIFGTRSKEYFGRHYSEVIYDYEDDITYVNTNGDGLEEYYIEISEEGKKPLIISFYRDKNDNYYI